MGNAMGHSTTIINQDIDSYLIDCDERGICSICDKCSDIAAGTYEILLIDFMKNSLVCPNCENSYVFNSQK